MKEKLIAIVRHADVHEVVEGYDLGTKLTEKGFDYISQLGTYIIQNKLSFDRIAASTEPMTKITAQRLALCLEYPVDSIRFDPDLYNASLSHIIHTIQMLNEDVKHFMIVGSEVTIAHFGEYLTGKHIKPLPYCSMICYSIEGHHKWSDITNIPGHQKFVWIPKA